LNQLRYFFNIKPLKNQPFEAKNPNRFRSDDALTMSSTHADKNFLTVPKTSHP